MCGSWKARPGDYRILLLDIKKAFLYGNMSRNVYIELPAEDPMSEGRHLVGKLDKAIYGTRDAPAEWQGELERTMIKLGFRPVVPTPCLYSHSSLNVLVGHVDDLICVGPRIGLDTFLAKLMSMYDLTSTFLGPGPGEEQEGKFLGRSHLLEKLRFDLDRRRQVGKRVITGVGHVNL